MSELVLKSKNDYRLVVDFMPSNSGAVFARNSMSPVRIEIKKFNHDFAGTTNAWEVIYSEVVGSARLQSQAHKLGRAFVKENKLREKFDEVSA